MIGRTFAAVKNYQVDVNKEMVALGTMNIVDSMTSCYVATVRALVLVEENSKMLIYQLNITKVSCISGAKTKILAVELQCTTKDAQMLIFLLLSFTVAQII